MPVWTPTVVAEGALAKPSTVNPNFSSLQTVVNALDTDNIASKFVSSPMTFVMVGGQTQATFAPHANDGIYYFRGWTIEQNGFSGGDSVKFTVYRVLKASPYTEVAISPASPAIVAGSPFTQIDETVVAIANTQAIRVKVTTGSAIPSGKSVSICLNLGTVLMKSSDL